MNYTLDQNSIEELMQKLGLMNIETDFITKVLEPDTFATIKSRHGNFKPHNRSYKRKADIKVKAKRSESLRRSGWDEKFCDNPKYWEKIGSISHNNDQYFAGRNKPNDMTAKERRWMDAMNAEDGGTMEAIYAEMEAVAEAEFNFHKANLDCVCDAITDAIRTARAIAEEDELLHDELTSTVIALYNALQDVPQI